MLAAPLSETDSLQNVTPREACAVYVEIIKRRSQNSDFPVDAADTDARVELIWSFGGLNEIKGFDGIFHKLDAHRRSFSSVP